MQFQPSIPRRRTISMLFSRALVVIALTLAPAIWAKDCFVYFGTFTDTTSKGIYVSRLDMETGKLSDPQLAAQVGNPNYLAVSPDGHFLYAAARGDNSIKGGAINSYAIDGSTGHLKLLDQKSSSGAGPCYVGTDASGQCVFAANYVAGSVKSFHVNADGALTDGTLIQHDGHSINPDRQKGPHAHCFVAAPAGQFALACDLGLDKVMVYKFNASDATLTPNKPPFAAVTPGWGPRHLAFSPDGKTACVLSEMACKVTVFDWDGASGKLQSRQAVSLLPLGAYQPSFTAAEIAYRPDGRFVYATVRGPNRVSVLAVDATTGDLSLVQNLPSGGDFPRGMGIDPSGHWLIVGNQKSGTITAFSIDADTGKLAPTGQVLNVGSALDVKFAPAQ
jgi:6-phosphogluconolactonase